MTAGSPSELAARWLEFAHDDLGVAEQSAADTVVPHVGCYHAHQAAEKALKAILVLLQIQFPFTHDLDGTRDLIPPGWHVVQAFPDLQDLSQWAVRGRYPGNWPMATDADARATARLARDVWETVLIDLDQHGFDVSPF